MRIAPSLRLFRYRRAITLPPAPARGSTVAAAPRACAVLDATVYQHAELALSDLRIFAATPAGMVEEPYALTSSGPAAAASDAAEVRNLGMTGGRVSFDLVMPARPYSEVDLELGGSDFVATAQVSGRDSAGGRAVALGSFTLFDLAGQHLSRSTSLPLGEVTFPLLHVELSFSGAAGRSFSVSPALVLGAHVPPSREAQTLYTPVAETATLGERGRESVASFALPAHVPVEEVQFLLAPGDNTSFSRRVRITARAPGEPNTGDAPLEETVPGEILRVRTRQAGREIRVERLGVPAILGLNSVGDARLEVAVENGDDRPLAFAGVRLLMRERRLCLDVRPYPAQLFYGASHLEAPVYDYSRTFDPMDPVRVARLGPETANPAYVTPAAPHRAWFAVWLDTHPQLLWIALLAVVAALGLLAYRSIRRM